MAYMRRGGASRRAAGSRVLRNPRRGGPVRGRRPRGLPPRDGSPYPIWEATTKNPRGGRGRGVGRVAASPFRFGQGSRPSKKIGPGIISNAGQHGQFDHIVRGSSQRIARHEGIYGTSVSIIPWDHGRRKHIGR